MISQELINWVIKEKEKGYTSEQLYKSLVENNYEPKDAKELSEITVESIAQTQEVIQPHKRKKRYVLKIIFILLIVLIGYYVANSFDVPKESIHNENLILSPNIIPDEKNSFFELERLSKEINAELKNRKTSTGKTFEDIAVKLTASNGKRKSLKDFFDKVKYTEVKEVYYGMKDFFPQIDALMQIPQYQSPYYADIASLSFEELMTPTGGIALQNFPTEIFSLVRLQKLRIMYLFLENKNKLAIKTLTETLQFFQRTLSGNIGLFEFFYYGITLPRIMLEELDVFFQTKKLSYSDLLTIKKSTEYFQDTTAGLERALKSEYMFIDLTLQADLTPQEMMSVVDYYWILKYSPYHFKKNKMRRYLSEQFQHILDPTFEIKNKPPRDFPRITFILFHENGLGNLLFGRLPTNKFDLDKLKQKKSDTYFRLFSVQVALQGYFEKNKELPDSLQDLIPEFMDSFPSDSFGDFEYLPKEKLLRSKWKSNKGEQITYKFKTW